MRNAAVAYAAPFTRVSRRSILSLFEIYRVTVGCAGAKVNTVAQPKSSFLAIAITVRETSPSFRTEFSVNLRSLSCPPTKLTDEWDIFTAGEQSLICCGLVNCEGENANFLCQAPENCTGLTNQGFISPYLPRTTDVSIMLNI